MTPGKLAVLVGVLVALTGIATVLRWQARKTESLNPLDGVKPGTVVKMVVDRGAKTYSLEKTDGTWRLTDPVKDLADQEKAEVAVEQLLFLNLGSIVSRKPESYPNYELQEASATRMRLFVSDDPTPAFDGYFGKKGLGFNSLYFRFSREEPVYLTTGISPYALQKTAEHFRDRSLLRLDSGDLKSVSLKAGTTALKLRRSSATWKAEGRLMPAQSVDALISRLLALKAAEFSSEDPKKAFAEPALTAEFESPALKARYTIGSLLKSGEPRYHFARVDGRKALLLVAAEDVESILKLISP